MLATSWHVSGMHVQPLVFLVVCFTYVQMREQTIE